MDLTEQVGTQVMRVGGEFVKNSLEFIQKLFKQLEENGLDNNPDAKVVIKYWKDNKDKDKYNDPHNPHKSPVYNFHVKDEFVADMKRHLNELGVACIVWDAGNGDDSKLFIIRDIDQQKAEFATKLVMAEHGQQTQFEKDEFVNMTPKSELACVSGLSIHEFELFREKAKDNGLKYAATVDEKNQVSILYNFNDKEKLEQSIKQMTWNMTGRNGDEYEAVYRTKVEAQEYMKTMYKKKAQPMYLVDARHPERVLKIDKEDLALCLHYDKDLSKETNFENAITLKISDKKYVVQLNEMIAKLEEPVVISEKEFRDREKVLQRKVPKLDQEWEAKEAPYRDLYDEKLKSEHEYRLNGMSVFEHPFSFTEFVEQEVVFGDNELKPTVTELKEIDEHVRDSMVQVKNYQYYEPKDNQLQKILEEVKKKKTLERAKAETERQKGKEMAKENKRNRGKSKDSELE